jgi:hypothetical protein
MNHNIYGHVGLFIFQRKLLSLGSVFFIGTGFASLKQFVNTQIIGAIVLKFISVDSHKQSRKKDSIL